jgi:hypothetical protein
MEMRKLILTLVLLGGIFQANAQQSYQPPRILFLVDGSALMLQPSDSNKSKFQIVTELILNIMDSVYKLNIEAEFALRAYGQQNKITDSDCYDTKLEVGFSKDNYTQMSLRLAAIKPKGKASLIFSLKEAIANELFADNRYKHLLIVITSGSEDCSFQLTNEDKKKLLKLSCTPYFVTLGVSNNETAIAQETTILNAREIPQITSDFVTHCYESLQARNINRHIHEEPNIRSVRLIKKDTIDTTTESELNSGYGYLKIDKNNSTNKLSLFYLDLNDSEYKPLSKLNITSLISGQRLKLKAGKYRLSYETIENNRLQLQARFFTITAKMISEISLL